ncbi:LacI family DNA-binding transcriptional regulator [Rhodohalobacter sp. 8-1]|uniref:LacI family DNA-binding transcriptional regulator n=1 Tax=Rhodohalobacter sp. 8-1 TaxID=3131972 RepID=UPI0030ECFF4B
MPNTIYDIAKAAGVSIATVSRVFNEKGRVRESTRNKVLAVADKMGYHPQVFAQGLARKKKNSIMMFIPIISNHFFMEVLSAIQDKLTAKNFELNIVHITSDEDPFKQVEYQIKRQWADGYLFVSLHFEKNKWEVFKKFEVPISVIDDSNPFFDSVNVDNVEGSYLATDYFIKKGFKRIAYLSAAPDSVPVIERLTGYEKALSAAGIEIDDYLIQRGDDMARDGFTEKSGYQAMKKILSIDPLPEACVCASDIKAIGAMKAMEETGKHIPLIGYDNLTIAEYIGLSTVHQPIYKMGAEATESLIKRISKPKEEPTTLIYKPELVIRSSSEVLADSKKIA